MTTACSPAPTDAPSPGAGVTRPASAPGYRVVRTLPHDPSAFTQGLVIAGGAMYESTGQRGSGSSIRHIDLATGRVVKRVALRTSVFAEGLAAFGSHLYQLTLQDHVVNIYDRDLHRVSERSYDGEAWGLTSTASHLVLSDGTSTLSILEPSSFEVTKKVQVTHDGASVEGLNELERVGDDVLANVFGSSRIARIDLATGRVRSWIDLSALVRRVDATDEEAVLNGIAVDPVSGHLYVTGKLWPKMFEIELTD